MSIGSVSIEGQCFAEKAVAIGAAERVGILDEARSSLPDLTCVGGSSSPMETAKERAERRKRHAAEVEASQEELRHSISETERLVDQSEKMLRRHRLECEEGDAGVTRTTRSSTED